MKRKSVLLALLIFSFSMFIITMGYQDLVDNSVSTPRIILDSMVFGSVVFFVFAYRYECNKGG